MALSGFDSAVLLIFYYAGEIKVFEVVGFSTSYTVV